MILESQELHFRPTEGVDYQVQPSGAWLLQTKHTATSIMVIRKFLYSAMSGEHTLVIMDVGHDGMSIDGSIEVMDTYTSIWSALDVISVCMLREQSYARWIRVSKNNQIAIGMNFKKHIMPYGLYSVKDGKLKKK